MSSQNRVAEELSKAAGITTEQAQKVLSVMHFDKLIERVQAIEGLASDPKAQLAIGMIDKDVSSIKSGELEKQLTLANLRLVPSRHAKMAHSVLNVLSSPK